jgi:hypothetical protein
LLYFFLAKETIAEVRLFVFRRRTMTSAAKAAGRLLSFGTTEVVPFPLDLNSHLIWEKCCHRSGEPLRQPKTDAGVLAWTRRSPGRCPSPRGLKQKAASFCWRL